MNQTVAVAQSATIGQSFPPVTDEHLVAAAQSGDTLAFAELRSRHSFRMRRLLYRITKNWDDADDALQDCFLKVFLHLRGFENRSSFSTWLTTIAINSGRMILRKRRGDREIPIDGGEDMRPDTWWELRDRSEDPETYCVRREREEMIRQAILRLPPDHRTVVELREGQEYSMKELSESLGISLPAAKSRLLRARKELRSSLRQKYARPNA